MDISRYLEVLGRRKWVVILTMLAALMVAAIGTRMMTPVYSATSMVRIAETRTGPVGYSDLNYSERLQNTYVQLLQSRASLATVIDHLGLKTSPEALAGSVKAEAVPSTELIRITASSREPSQAAAIADALAGVATSQQQDAYIISEVEAAAVPTTPVRPRPELYLPLGALAGLLGGLALALVVENLDKTIHSSEGAATTAGVPLLGWVPAFRRRNGRSKEAVLVDEGERAAVEAFRGLSASTLARVRDLGASEDRTVSVLVTSAEPGAGKSTILANLAGALARDGNRVVVVGSDLRHRDLARVFGIGDGPMRVVSAVGRDHIAHALRDTRIPDVRVLPAAALSGSDSLPGGARMRELVQSLSGVADVVLMDSPGLSVSADASILAPTVDGVLLVASRDRTSERELASAAEQISVVGGRILGIVFNRAELPADGARFSERPASIAPVAPRPRQRMAMGTTTVQSASHPDGSLNGNSKLPEEGLEKAG